MKKEEGPLSLDCSPGKRSRDATESEPSPVTPFKSFHLRLFASVFIHVATHPHFGSLLTDDEREAMRSYFDMPNEDYQVFVFKLYARLHQWHNLHKLAKDTKIEMDVVDLQAMYYILEEKGFVFTGKFGNELLLQNDVTYAHDPYPMSSLDYSSEPLEDLLNLLLVDDIKSICSTLRLKNGARKEVLIESLLKNCRSQPTLNPKHSPELVLRDLIKKKMGMCVKLSDRFKATFGKVHLLYTGPTTEFSKPSDLYFYLGKVESGEVLLPGAVLDANTRVFESLQQFEAYDKLSLSLVAKLHVNFQLFGSV